MQSLLAAVSRGDIPTLESLLRNGADINTRGLFEGMTKDENEELTMLEAAASHCQLEIMKYLIHKGADVNMQKNGDTVLLTASFQGNPQVVDLLLTNGADIHCKRFEGASVLHETVAGNDSKSLNGRIATLEKLLNHGIDIDIADEEGHTALHCAALYGALEMAVLLVNKGATINAKNKWGDVPLDRAALEGRVEVAEFLVEKGAEVNNNEGGCNGLGQAASYGHMPMIKLLLDHGAKAIPKRFKRPELLCAARSGNAAAVSLLYERGFDLQAPESLFKAALIDPPRVVELLLLQNMDINVKNAKGQSALHCAVMGKRFERSNSQGVLHPRLEVLQLLLEKGIDTTIEDSNGQTAKDLAAASDYIEAVKLFNDQGT